VTTIVLRLNYPFPDPKNNAEREANRRASDEYERQTNTAEEAPADDDPGLRNIGCQIVCSPEVADEIAQRLREAVGEILDDYTDDDVFDYGVD
jgi:hypothetical protein